MDRETFTQNVLRNERLLYCTARMLLSPSDCEDAVQSAILIAWEKLHTLRNEPAFDSWLLRILTNECYQLLRTQKRERERMTQRESCTPHETQYVYDALNTLEDQERLLILLHHDYGYSLKETAQIIGMPQAIIKMRLYRARKKLRSLLSEEE